MREKEKYVFRNKIYPHLKVGLFAIFIVYITSLFTITIHGEFYGVNIRNVFYFKNYYPQ